MEVAVASFAAKLSGKWLSTYNRQFPGSPPAPQIFKLSRRIASSQNRAQNVRFSNCRARSQVSRIAPEMSSFWNRPSDRKFSESRVSLQVFEIGAQNVRFPEVASSLQLFQKCAQNRKFPKARADSQIFRSRARSADFQLHAWNRRFSKPTPEYRVPPKTALLAQKRHFSGRNVHKSPSSLQSPQSDRAAKPV